MIPQTFISGFELDPTHSQSAQWERRTKIMPHGTTKTVQRKRTTKSTQRERTPRRTEGTPTKSAKYPRRMNSANVWGPNRY